MTRKAAPEEGFRIVHDALTAVVVRIGKEHVPILWEGLGVHRKAVVLRGDEAALRSFMDARLVMPTVSIPKTRRV